MTLKHRKFAFLLFLAGFLPAMGMNWKWSKDNEFYEIHNYQIEEDCTFKLEDIKKIAETDIDKGILLEQHLEDVGTITSTIASKNSFPTIGAILNDHLDKQQKMMGLIECASFINNTPVLNSLIRYGLVKNLIPNELLEGSDNTVKSFYQIKNVINAKPQQTLKLVKEVLPNIEDITEYPLDQDFDPITNDIKTTKYKYDEEVLGITDALSAFNVVKIQNNPLKVNMNSKKLQLQDERIKIIQKIFNRTSLPNKIALILRLKTLNEFSSKNIAMIPKPTFIDTLGNLASLGAFFVLCNAPLILRFMHELDSKNPSTIQGAIKNISLPTKYSMQVAALTSIPLSIFYNLKVLDPSLNSLPTNFSSFCIDSIKGSMATFLLASPLYFPATCLLLDGVFCVKLFDFFLDEKFGKKLYAMKQEQKNIQNLIEEFKESVKEEYPAVAKGYGGHGKN